MALKKGKAKVSVSTQEAIAELFNKLDEAGCDPIAELATLAMDPNTPLSDRISIMKDLAQYTAPKRRAVDISTSSEEGITVKIVKYTKDPVGQVRKMMDPEVLKQELDKVNPEEEAEQVQQAGGK
jgi:hypothetical protein